MRQIVLKDDLYEKIEHASQLVGVNIADFIEKALTKEIGMLNERSVLDLYQSRKISLHKAASLLGCDIWEMLEIIRRADIPIDYSREELSEDLA